MKTLHPLEKRLPDSSLVDISSLTNVTDQLDGAMAQDIVFYNLDSTKKAKDIFAERLKKANPGLIILRGKSGVDIKVPHVVLPQKQFFDFQKELCDFFYPFPKGKKIVGITGTNGKTSVCHLLSQILVQIHIPVLTIGTLGINIDGRPAGDSTLTTPSYIDLRKIFFRYNNKFEIAVMELSSHALEQNRPGEIKINLGAWTNFTQDHLDYHKTMDKYFMAKAKIFDHLIPGGRVVIDPKRREIVDKLSIPQQKQVTFIDFDKFKFSKDKIPPLFCRGLMYQNMVMAFSCACEITSLELRDQLDGLKFLTFPPGRFTIIQRKNKTVVIDYAHTPDALKNLLEIAKYFFAGKKINLLFGCGGNRDVQKRPLMGQTALTYADKIYLTSDNPRREEPKKIIAQIGLPASKTRICEVDRKKAIVRALCELGPKEVLLIAGKGHERYQEINGVRYDFNDTEIVEEILCD